MMIKMVKKLPIVRVNEGFENMEDLVAIDAHMEMVVNGNLLGKFYLSPCDLEEFAVGYLLDEGFISSPEEIKKLKISSTMIDIELESYEDSEYLNSYDGWIHREKQVPQVFSDFKVNKKLIFSSFNKLLQEARVWKKTGGTHVAALVNGNQFILKEDVSRHVAIDKIIGSAALQNINLEHSFIVCSGRIPPDRVAKLANVGIPIMVTKAAPTTEGIKMGRIANITLIGFLRGGRFNIYTHPERIII